MLGLIEFDENSGRPCLTRRQILGCTFLTLNLGRAARGALAGYHAGRWARQMRKQGVRTAVFPVDFPYTAVFLREGITPVDPLPLQRAVCADCVRRRLEELQVPPAQAVVAVAGEHMSREMEETARALALSYRYVLLSVPSGGEEFAREMRRRYGAALLLHPSADQLERADALVLFSPRPELSRKNRVLCSLYYGSDPGRGQVRFALSETLAEAVGPNCATDQLAAALYSMGALALEMGWCEITC